MSWAKVKKVNSNMAIPLDQLITDKTNVKIQMVTFNFENNTNLTKNIDAVDVSKSIIIPVSYINEPYTTSISFGFSANNIVFCNRTVDTYQLYFNYTLAVITFGGDVI